MNTTAAQIVDLEQPAAFAPATPQGTLGVQPWPEPVDGNLLLDELRDLLERFVILPDCAAETLALWIIHTYTFQLREVSTYLGIESPEKRCGKTTLLTILGELAHRALLASNISPPAFFRVIEELRPTLLIDEADTFLQGNDPLRGILNAGYKKKTAIVWRASSAPSAISQLPPVAFEQPGQVTSFSCWCPKVICQIGRLPDTLADRCIVIHMQRKTSHEECERFRNLDTTALRRKCARFALDHAEEIANAKPEIPDRLNDRAADIWEPLLAIADLGGAAWPESARQAATHLSAGVSDSNQMGSLLLDIFVSFIVEKSDRIFSRDLADRLDRLHDPAWASLKKGKGVTPVWLSRMLSPYGIRPKTIWIGDDHAKGYLEEDCIQTFQRYIPRSEVEALRAQIQKPKPESGDQNP